MNKTIKCIIGIFIVVILLFGFKVFEIDFGRCLNDAGDGKLYNGEPFYNYISYRYTSAKQDDIVMTFSVNDFKYKECLWRGDIVILRNTKES